MKKLILLYFVSLNLFASTDFNIAKDLFRSNSSTAESLTDFIGSWTPNQLYTKDRNVKILGHVKDHENFFSGLLDGFKYYNQIVVQPNSHIVSYMDDLIYNVFKPDQRVYFLPSESNIVMNWTRKVSGKNAKNIYGVRHLVNPGIHSQVCNLINSNQMICEQNIDNNSELTRYLVYDRL